MCLASVSAHAFLLAGQIETLAALERGDFTIEDVFRIAAGTLAAGAPIDPASPFFLSLGERLEVSLFGSGRSGADEAEAGEASGFITITFDLAPTVDRATVLVDLVTSVDTTGADAFAVGGFNFNCAVAWGCRIGDGSLPERYGEELTSDTLFGNGMQMFDNGIPGPFMPNGNQGGMEMMNFRETFTIDRSLAPSSPTLRCELGLTYNLGAISSTVDVTHTLSITVVPLPAAAWLFASALGLSGWLWRRTTRVAH